jgi:hypothetical protein
MFTKRFIDGFKWTYICLCTFIENYIFCKGFIVSLYMLHSFFLKVNTHSRHSLAMILNVETFSVYFGI